jgi:hypothetical protein
MKPIGNNSVAEHQSAIANDLDAGDESPKSDTWHPEGQLITRKTAHQCLYSYHVKVLIQLFYEIADNFQYLSKVCKTIFII